MTINEKGCHTGTVRDIIEIDETLCNGCGECIGGCAEGALALVEGKAKLVSDSYCDGLGNCLAHCPTGALKVIRRAAPDFDEEAVALLNSPGGQKLPSCPGSQSQAISKPAILNQGMAEARPGTESGVEMKKESGLISWPIQLKLAPQSAPYFDQPVVVLASDCSAFAGPSFHEIFLTSGHPLVIACPKLDETEPYIDKLADILKNHPTIVEIRVVMMSVPCCGRLSYIATQAIKKAGREEQVTLRTWVVTPQGQITEEHIR